MYIRWSTEEQARGTTLEVQENACRNFIATQGWMVRDDLIFLDDGYSGATLDRPSMTLLRKHVARGEIDCVVVHKIDRLSRNLLDTVSLVLREWDGKCAIRSVSEPIDSTTDNGRVLFSFLAVFAEHERALIRDRTVSGRLTRTQAGEINPTRVAFGYRLAGGKRGVWEEHPAEGPLVRHIFRLAADGLSIAEISKELRTGGVTTKTGREFTIDAVKHILNNPLYRGELIYGQYEVKREALAAKPTSGDDFLRRSSYKLRKVKRQAPLVYRIRSKAFPAIVEDELWKEAHAQLDRNREARSAAGGRGFHSEHLLTGVLQCECGSNMIFRSPQSGRYGYYVCGAKLAKRRCSVRTSIPAEVAESFVEGAFFGMLVSGWRGSFGKRLRDLHIDRAAAIAGLDAAKDEQVRLTDLVHYAHENAQEVGIDQQTLNEYLHHLEGLLANSARAIHAAQKRLVRTEMRSVHVRELERNMVTIDQWKALPVPRRRYLMQMVLNGKVTVRRTAPNRFEFSFPLVFPLS